MVVVCTVSFGDEGLLCVSYRPGVFGMVVVGGGGFAEVVRWLVECVGAQCLLGG